MLYVLIGFVCSFVGVCIGWHFGEKSGIKYGFDRGKVAERCGLISMTFPVKCPACNKEFGLEVQNNRTAYWRDVYKHTNNK